MNNIPKHNQNKINRRSIRLKGFDYAQEGMYFITICCQDLVCLFGEIVNFDTAEYVETEPFDSKKIFDKTMVPPLQSKMILNDAGKMIEKWFFKLEKKFLNIKCHSFVVMPNHFHCIIQIVGTEIIVASKISSQLKKGEHMGSPLHRQIQWFKTMTTNEYIRCVKTLGWRHFNVRLWQRNYYEHIIRNEKSFLKISEYIMNNPAKWTDDKFCKQ